MTDKRNEILRAAANATAPVTGPRKLYEIAREIKNDWRQQKSGIYFGAEPYLEAMFSLSTMQDMYGCDTAQYIVTYFLANARTWTGPVAKRVKAELKQMAK